MVDCQEIRIHWLYVSATGFGEHKLQRSESLLIPLKRKQLSVVKIEIERTKL